MKFDIGEDMKKFIMVVVGFIPTTPKPMVLPTTPFVKVLVGY